MVLDRFGVVIDWVRKKRQTSSWEAVGKMLHNDDFVEEMSGGEWPEDTREHIDEIFEHSRRLEIEEQYFDRFTDRCRSSDISSNDVLKGLGDRGFQNFLESCRRKGVPDTKYVVDSALGYLSIIHRTFSDDKVSEGLVYSKNPDNQNLALFGTISMAADIGWNVFIVLTDPSEESVSSFISRFSSNLSTNNGTYSWQIVDLSQATGTLIDVFVDSKNDRRYLITLPKKRDRLDVLSRWFDSKKDKASSMRIFAIDEASIPLINNPEKILSILSKDRVLIEKTLLNDLLESRGCYRSYLKFVPNVPFELDKACDFKGIMYYDFIEQFNILGYPPDKEDESRFRNAEDFQRIIERYREESVSESDKGRRFEELIRRYLLTDPTYTSQFQWVCLWNDFFARDQLGKQDTGIDLVAKTKSGKYWAIQCKCYAEDYYVTKADMDTFISTSGRTFIDETGEKCGFSYRLVVASTDRFNSNARSVLEGQTVPALILGLHQLANAPVIWSELDSGNMGQGARSSKYQLQKHQQAALECAIKHYAENDRGKMIMACGTGKTFTSLKITEYLLCDKLCNDEKCTVLFLAPSISLVGQTLREWMGQVSMSVNPICVCSDVSVGRNKVQLDMSEHVEDLGVPSTTDPGAIVLQSMMDGHTFIFSTYQSIDAIIEAQKKGLPEFDVVVCDEAHRTTGACSSEDKKSDFNKIHSDKDVKAKKRLYMTATPRIYGEKATKSAEAGSIVLYSMDDESIYGKEFYRISFGEAVEQDLLTDYKVMILTLKESEVPGSLPNMSPSKKEIDADMDTLIWGCLNALAKNVAYDETLKQTDPENMKSAVVFCRTINRSKDIAERFNQIAAIPESPIRLEVQHIDGSMNSMERDRKLTWLKIGDEDTCHALSNVRCLCEGVDVPALDAVMFMDSKGSLVDVVQSVGRVMRRAPGKKYGYIIIPVLIPGDGDAEEALNSNERYKVVWDVLRALRSHDERLDAEINTFQMRKSNAGQHIHIARILPPQAFPSERGDDEYVPYLTGQYHLDDFNGKLLARLVLKVGDREYIENWAKDVAKVMPALMEKLKIICTGETYDDEFCNPDFNEYHKALKFCVNENVSEEDAIKMLAQQIVTKPIFEKLFGDQGFVKDNSVSKTIDNMLDKINADNSLAEINQQLEDFYRGVERTMSLVNTADGKQKVITALYEKFFKNAFPKDQAINGVVYTPIEIVNFILRSAADILKQEFDRDINDEGVNILDPFTGTGTFIAQLMESGLITPENLERKYTKELYANEITLLAYYIAAVNIENTYTRITGIDGYLPFENILLTDTFNIEEICRRYGTGSQMTLDTEDGYFSKNRAIIRREASKPITLIVGNPPYGSRQKTASDDAKKRKYREGIDARIESVYLDQSLFSSKVGLVNSVYDNYIRAFRWATDRLGDNDGIIAFVTPNGWMTGSAFEGFRKVIEKEFSKIYVFNLRGDGAGIYKQEGDNVFVFGTNRGCKTGIAITLLVKRKVKKSKTQVYYQDIMTMGEGYHVLEKRATIEKCGSFLQMLDSGKLKVLTPKPNGDWLVERNGIFDKLTPLAGDVYKKFDKHKEDTIFEGYSLGYATNRDLWCYNCSKKELEHNMVLMCSTYNEQMEAGQIIRDRTRIAWSRDLEQRHSKKQRLSWNADSMCRAMYRPFSKRWFSSDQSFINMVYQMPMIYPQGCENLTICVSGIGVKKSFSCLMTNCPTDLEIVGKSQCFPLYWYNIKETLYDSKQSKLMDFEQSAPVRHDGISQFARDKAKKKYGVDVSSEDLFFYVYGYLHSPEYRSMFSDNLKLSLPKIGLVNSYDDFMAFSEAGRKLSELHTEYEDVEPYQGVRINGDAPIEDILGKKNLHQVTKMKLIPDKHRLIYNEYITIDDIPNEAFEYVVNGRSALGWIVDRYQITTDKDSGIVNDPNEYAGSTYILKLVLSVITVSMKTMEIVKNLPSIGLDNDMGES